LSGGVTAGSSTVVVFHIGVSGRISNIALARLDVSLFGFVNVFDGVAQINTMAKIMFANNIKIATSKRTVLVSIIYSCQYFITPQKKIYHFSFPS
jgi:hypothetical protein